jgi:hypothetical protein
MAGAAALLLVTACGQPARVETQLLGYDLLKDLEETSTQVRLLIIADKPGRDKEGCGDLFDVPLTGPLGDRAVIDASSGLLVTARPG